MLKPVVDWDAPYDPLLTRRRRATTKFHGNPLVLLYGVTPEKQCKTCKHLTGHRRARTYYKCLLRGVTHGPGTDHRVGWPACGRYETAEGHGKGGEDV